MGVDLQVNVQPKERTAGGVREGGGGAGGGARAMHGRSRVSVDPRIPTIPRRSTPGCPLTGKALLAPSGKRGGGGGDLQGRRIISETTRRGTMATTGTIIPRTATPFNPICAKRFCRHWGEHPALVHLTGTTQAPLAGGEDFTLVKASTLNNVTHRCANRIERLSCGVCYIF